MGRLPQCEHEGCGYPGVRTIMVDGYRRLGAAERNIQARELACRGHVGAMIAFKQQTYQDMGLKVPDMWHVATEV